MQSDQNWTDNNDDFTIEFNTPRRSLAYIEDFYDLKSAPPGAANVIQGDFLEISRTAGEEMKPTVILIECT